jgi:hypothetical protein
MSFKESYEDIALEVEDRLETALMDIEYLCKKIDQLEKENASLKKNSISLRDHFAGLAIQGVIQTTPGGTQTVGSRTVVAKNAYEWADVMLVERNKDERNTLLDK